VPLNELLEGESGYLPETASPKEKDVVPPHFFVNTAKCKIPYVDPFEPNAMAVFHPEHFKSCSNESALVTPIYDVIIINHNFR